MLLKLTEFTQAFVMANRLDFARWRFEPGMRHGDTLAWWGSKAPRRHVHHGIDFAFYEKPDGSFGQLEAGMLVPLPVNAHISAIIKDFIGHTVIAVHGKHHGRLLIGLYGHVTPRDRISGRILEAGSIVAELASAGKGAVPPHLHMGFALIPEEMHPETLSWDVLTNAGDVEHLDPMAFL